jgi:hypothetical protein
MNTLDIIGRNVLFWVPFCEFPPLERSPATADRTEIVEKKYAGFAQSVENSLRDVVVTRW